MVNVVAELESNLKKCPLSEALNVYDAFFKYNAELFSEYNAYGNYVLLFENGKKYMAANFKKLLLKLSKEDFIKQEMYFLNITKEQYESKYRLEPCGCDYEYCQGWTSYII